MRQTYFTMPITQERIKSKRMITWLLVLVVMFVILSAGIWGVTYTHNKPLKNQTVLTVNNEPVTVSEFQRQIERLHGSVYSYFSTKYGATDSAHFWTTAYGGEIPVDTLRKQALDTIVRIKVEQILAKEQGVVQDISYDSFLKALTVENNRRAEAVKKHAVIFGPVQYDEQTYFDYLQSMMVVKVKDKLKEQEFSLNGEQLKERYESLKDAQFKLPDTVKVQKISIPARDSEGHLLAVNKLQPLREAAERIKKRLDQGEQADQIVKEFSRDSSIAAKLEEQTFDNSTIRNDDEFNPLLRDAALQLQIGQTSGVILENNIIQLVICTERTENGYAPLEKVETQLAISNVDERYDERIEQLMKEVRVVKDEELYSKMNAG